MNMRDNLKSMEVTTSRDLQDAEKFDQLTQTYEERKKKIEAIVTILKESKNRNVLIARRDLDLIQVNMIMNNMIVSTLHLYILKYSLLDTDYNFFSKLC